MLIPMALALRSASTSLTDRRLAVIGIALALPALILTGSRGGWTALLISLGCTAAFSRRIDWKRVVTVGLVGAVSILPFINLIADRVLGDDNGAAATRIPLNAIALRMIGSHPLLGVGANNFPLVMDLYSSTVGEWLYTVHNTYLLVWSETGTFALLAFVGILGVTIRTGLRWKRTSEMHGIVALGCAAAILGHMAHMGVDLFRAGAPAELLWILGGLTLAANRMQSGSETTNGAGRSPLTRR
jgi:O-antigen ligase